MKIHVFKSPVESFGDSTFTARCGARVTPEQCGGMSPRTEADLEGTTCLHCLKQVMDNSLWKADVHSGYARTASIILDTERRRGKS